MDPVHGIEFSGGSLGQGLSLGMGTALGLKKKGLLSPKIYVIVGDGECDEGQVWEAAAAVTHFELNSVTVIVDDNGLQFDGRKEDILKSGDAAGRWKSLGFDVVTVDGHDVEALRNALRREVPDRPKVVIAKTVKGKGVHFAENDVTWHTGRLTDELYQEAIRDIND
jgi:transketolase